MRHLWITAFVAFQLAVAAMASDYAVQALDDYDPNADGIPFDALQTEPNGDPIYFDKPYTALGRPTIDTTGDGFFGCTGSVTAAVPVVPVYQPFRWFEVVTIGAGGQLTLKFDHVVQDDPLNPCGIDFIVFGNTNLNTGGTGFWCNGDPNQNTVSGQATGREPALVSVSQDGITWYPFTNGPYADDFPPTLGRRFDPAHYEPTLPENLWWGQPTDPTYPIDPRLTGMSFAGWTVAQIATKYGWSAGGAGFDLGQLVSLPPPVPPLSHRWIQYVRITNPANSGVFPEIDAVADVAPRLLPDLDCDSDVDNQDLEVFISCQTGPAMGPPSAGCERADFDRDLDVDADDFAILQRCRSGSGVLMDPTCMPG